jgi:hypothetical protein
MDFPNTFAHNPSEWTGSRSKDGIFLRTILCWPLLRLCRPFCILERCWIGLLRLSRTRELCKKSTAEEQKDWNKSCREERYARTSAIMSQSRRSLLPSAFPGNGIPRGGGGGGNRFRFTPNQTTTQRFQTDCPFHGVESSMFIFFNWRAFC